MSMRPIMHIMIVRGYITAASKNSFVAVSNLISRFILSVGVVGAVRSAVSMDIASLLNIYEISQVKAMTIYMLNIWFGGIL